MENEMSNILDQMAMFESYSHDIHHHELSFGIRVLKIWLITHGRWMNGRWGN